MVEVHNCYIQNYCNYDFSPEVSFIQPSHQHMTILNCIFEYRNSVFTRNVLNHNRTTKARKVLISRVYGARYTSEYLLCITGTIPNKQPVLEKENIKTKVITRCIYDNLWFIEISYFSIITTEHTINAILENRIFRSWTEICLTSNSLSSNSLFSDVMYRTMKQIKKIDLSRNSLAELRFLYNYRLFTFPGSLHVDLSQNRIPEVENEDVRTLKSLFSFQLISLIFVKIF